MPDPIEKLKLKTLAEQEQEWTEGREWFRNSDNEDIAWFFDHLNEGTRKSINGMSNEEIAVMCRLAVLALIEIVAKETFDAEKSDA
jgi:hypothetical protein